MSLQRLPEAPSVILMAKSDLPVIHQVSVQIANTKENEYVYPIGHAQLGYTRPTRVFSAPILQLYLPIQLPDAMF